MFARISLLLKCFVLLFLSTTIQADTFLESSGVVVIEAESAGATGSWSRESSIGGAKGGAYLVWKGPDFFATSSAGRDTLRYTFRVQQAGNYELRWRSYITEGNNPTEANDSWVRFPTGKNINGQHGLKGWTKVFMSQTKQWSWSAKTVDNVGKSVRQYFSKGDHVMEISGRSHGHAIDRIVLFHYADISYSQSKFDGYQVSSTVGGSQSPEPAPEPTPEPATAVTTTEPSADDALVVSAQVPVVVVAGNKLSWNLVEADGINIHGQSGEWLASIAGDSTEWTASATGSYYIVATNASGWESWGRSNTVDVAVLSDSASSGVVPSAINSLYNRIYSVTTAEIFWLAKDTGESSAFVLEKDGVQIYSGDARSFFDDQLASGVAYLYTLKVLDDGEVVDQWNLRVVTEGPVVAELAATDGSQLEGVNQLQLRGSVYSQSALELNWDRSTDENAAAFTYNLYQDGQLASSSDALSYFVDGLNPGQTYRFTLKVKDADGNEGTGYSLSLTTDAAE